LPGTLKWCGSGSARLRIDLGFGSPGSGSALNFKFEADPDPALTLIRIHPAFTIMRIRIWLPKMFRILNNAAKNRVFLFCDNNLKIVRKYHF
jgi:hypothetical protein